MDVAAANQTIASPDGSHAEPGAGSERTPRGAEYRIKVYKTAIGRFLLLIPAAAAVVVGLGLLGYQPIDAMFGSGMAAVVAAFGVFIAFASRLPGAFALVPLRGLVSDKDQAQYVAFEREIEGALNSRRQFAVGAVLTVFVAGGYFLIRTGLLDTVFGSGARTSSAEDLPIGLILLADAAIAVAAFAAGLVIWRMWVVGRKVHALGHRFRLRIQMGHPDGCGGFEPLGNLSLWNALILAVPGIWLGWWIPAAARNPYYEHWVPLFTTLAGVVVLLAIGTFLGPLWNVHVAMTRSAETIREEIEKRGRQIDELARELVAGADHLTPEEREKKAKDLELQQSIFRANEQIPTWPIDLRILLKFTSSQLVPLLGLTGLGKPVVEATSRLSDFLTSLGTR